MCDVGGLLGLWIGFSFLTIFEFVELLFDVIRVSIFRPKEKSGNSNQGNKVKSVRSAGPTKGVAVRPFNINSDSIMSRFDPDFKECFGHQVGTPSDVKMRFKTPSPQLLYGNENDDVSTIDMEDNKTGTIP